MQIVEKMADVLCNFGNSCFFSLGSEEKLNLCDKKLNLSDEDQAMAERKHFSWTDDEAELLLNITLEYKTEKIADCIDWESVRSKYADIRDRNCCPFDENRKRRNSRIWQRISPPSRGPNQSDCYFETQGNSI